MPYVSNCGRPLRVGTGSEGRSVPVAALNHSFAHVALTRRHSVGSIVGSSCRIDWLAHRRNTRTSTAFNASRRVEYFPAE